MSARSRRVLEKSALTVFAAAVLGACSSLPSMDRFSGGDVNYAAGSALEGNLVGADRAALAVSFRDAMNTGASQNWSGRRALGRVEPGGFAIASLKADPDERLEAARGDLDLTHLVETEMGLHVLTRNSNIRVGPNTTDKVAEVLPSGSGVDVVGRVRDKNWMLVAVKGVVRGYVYGDLLIKAPGSELELAGGPMRKPVLCRNFTQRVNLYSKRYEWDGAACNDGTGWRLAPSPIDNPPSDLIEF